MSLRIILVRALCLLTLCAVGTVSQPAWAKKKKKRKNSKRAASKRLDKKMKGSKYGLIGVRVGPNFASLSTAKSKDGVVESPESSVGVGFGVTADFGINDLFAFRVEGLYQNKNLSHRSLQDYTRGDTLLDSNTYLDYVEVPVMGVVRFMRGSFVRPYVAGGMYGAVLVNADGDHNDKGQNKDPRKPFTTFDYGWVAAAGSYFVLAKGMGFLGAELRYSSGLANIADVTQKFNDDTPLESQSYTLSNFSILVTYYF